MDVKLYFLSSFLFLLSQQISCLNEIDKKNIKLPIESPTPWIKSKVEFWKEMPKNSIVAEVGSLTMENAEEILLYCKPKHLYVVSFGKNNSSYSYICENNAQVTFIFIEKKKSGEAANLFENNFFDWVYIDPSFRYRPVKYKIIKRDLNNWFDKVRPHGILAGHDYVIPIGLRRFSVVRAVNEFVLERKLEISFLSTDYWASFAIMKK